METQTMQDAAQAAQRELEDMLTGGDTQQVQAVRIMASWLLRHRRAGYRNLARLLAEYGE